MDLDFGRRHFAAGFLSLLTAAAGGVVDPHHRFSADETPDPVSENDPPATVWRRAERNLLRTSWIWTESVYESPAATTPVYRAIQEYDPTARRFRVRSLSPKGGGWLVRENFYGETVEARLTGTVRAPTRDATVEHPRTASWPTRRGFDEPMSKLSLDVDPTALQTLSSDDAAVVVGARDAAGYADLTDADRRVEPGSSYRIAVSLETGRITEVVDRPRFRTEDGALVEYVAVHRFTNDGSTSVARPDWAPRHPLELLYDAVSL